MAREIRAPEQVTGFRDRAALLLYARAVAAIVARNTRHTRRHALECVVRDGRGCRVTGWIVFFVCVAAAAVSVAAWLDGYAEGVADGTRLLAEWCKEHMEGKGGGQ